MQHQVYFELEVVALWPDQQICRQISVKAGITAYEAILQSGVLDELGLTWPQAMGSYGQKIKAPQEYIVQPEDRLELYRPLLIDPKQARKARAVQHPVGRMLTRKKK